MNQVLIVLWLLGQVGTNEYHVKNEKKCKYLVVNESEFEYFGAYKSDFE